jgi:hypothetical protein
MKMGECCLVTHASEGSRFKHSRSSPSIISWASLSSGGAKSAIESGRCPCSLGGTRGLLSAGMIPRER